MTDRLDGKVAVVTGAGSGIGLATVRRFAADGARVVCADIDESTGRAAAQEVDGLFVRVDVTSEDDVEAMFAAAVDAYGGIDISFHNAGISPPDDDSILDTGHRRVAARAGRQPDVGLLVLPPCDPAAASARRRLDHQHRVRSSR